MTKRLARSLGLFTPDGGVWKHFANVEVLIDDRGHLHFSDGKTSISTSLAYFVEWAD